MYRLTVLTIEVHCFALSGRMIFWRSTHPGRCPGLSCYGPFRAKAKSATSKSVSEGYLEDGPPTQTRSVSEGYLEDGPPTQTRIASEGYRYTSLTLRACIPRFWLISRTSGSYPIPLAVLPFIRLTIHVQILHQESQLIGDFFDLLG